MDANHECLQECVEHITKWKRIVQIKRIQAEEKVRMDMMMESRRLMNVERMP